MAKKVIRYLLEGNGSVPAFVQDGGYFMRGSEMVGMSVDEDVRYVPATIVRMDRLALLDWIKEAHKVDGLYMVKNEEGDRYDDQDMEDACQNFLDQIGLSDYA